MIEQLAAGHVPGMLELQTHCLKRGDLFTPTSEEGYLLSFRFRNFALGIWGEDRCTLTAFLCCTIPSERASRNLGRGLLPDEMLDEVGHMNTLLIRAEHRGRGLGKALVKSGIGRLREGGAHYIFAVVSPGNAISRHMLSSLGFEEVRPIKLNDQWKIQYCLVSEGYPALGGETL